MTALPEIKTHNMRKHGSTTYFTDEHDHRLEVENEIRNDAFVMRHFKLIRGTRDVAHFVLHSSGELVFTFRMQEYDHATVLPFLASIRHLLTSVPVGHLPSLSPSR